MDKSIIKWTPPNKISHNEIPLPTNQKYQLNKQNQKKQQQKTTDM